jgi:hypothetical protein
MRIRAVASVLVSSSQPIRAAASFISAVVAASSVSIVAHATVVQPIRAEVYIPEILPLASANTVVTDLINSFSVNKVVVDVVEATETMAFSVGLVLEDSVTMADSATKTFTEVIDFDRTDADVDPDPVTVTDVRTASVGKVLTDSATATDSVAQTAEKVTTDAVTATDDNAKDVGKSVSDSVTLTDSAAFDVVRVSTDTVTASDADAKTVGKVVDDPADAVTATDTAALNIQPAYSDSVTASDDVVQDIGKTLTDSVTATEAQAFAVDIVLADSVTMTDSVFKDFSEMVDYDRNDTDVDPDPVTATDVAVWNIQPAYADTVEAADAINRFDITKNPSDAVTATDSIELTLLLGQSNPIYDFAFASDDKFTYFPVMGTLNSYQIHQPLVNGEFVLTTDPNAGIVYTIRSESASYMFGGYGLDATTLN